MEKLAYFINKGNSEAFLKTATIQLYNKVQWAIDNPIIETMTDLKFGIRISLPPLKDDYFDGRL